MARRPRIDRELARYLVPGERVVTAVRQHWVSQAAPGATLLAATAFALWIDIAVPPSPGGRSSANVGWLLWFVALGWLAWRLLNWRRDYFVATDKRFLLFFGFIRRKVAMMPLVKVTDMTFDRSVPGRILGYGTFRLESAGQDQALGRIDFVPQADAHYRAICAELFADRSGNSGSRTGAGRGRPGRQRRYAGGSPPQPEGAEGQSPPSGPYPRPSSGYEPPRTGPYPHGGPGPYPGVGGGSALGRGGALVVGESLYRSPDLVRANRLADTGEIPVVTDPPPPEPSSADMQESTDKQQSTEEQGSTGEQDPDADPGWWDPGR